MGVQPNDWTTERLPTDVAYRVSVPDREPPLRSPRIAPLEGRGIRVSRTFARHPRLSAVQGGTYNYVLGASPLTEPDRELLILRIGWNCQAEYEWAKHVGSVGRARDHGLEPLRIAEGPGAGGWSPPSMTLLTLADELYRDAMVSDETWAAITAEFDTRATISALMTVSTYRLVSMTLTRSACRSWKPTRGSRTFDDRLSPLVNPGTISSIFILKGVSIVSVQHL